MANGPIDDKQPMLVGSNEIVALRDDTHVQDVYVRKVNMTAPTVKGCTPTYATPRSIIEKGSCTYNCDSGYEWGTITEPRGSYNISGSCDLSRIPLPENFSSTVSAGSFYVVDAKYVHYSNKRYGDPVSFDSDPSEAGGVCWILVNVNSTTQSPYFSTTDKGNWAIDGNISISSLNNFGVCFGVSPVQSFDQLLSTPKFIPVFGADNQSESFTNESSFFYGTQGYYQIYNNGFGFDKSPNEIYYFFTLWIFPVQGVLTSGLSGMSGTLTFSYSHTSITKAITNEVTSKSTSVALGSKKINLYQGAASTSSFSFNTVSKYPSVTAPNLVWVTISDKNVFRQKYNSSTTISGTTGIVTTGWFATNKTYYFSVTAADNYSFTTSSSTINASYSFKEPTTIGFDVTGHPFVTIDPGDYCTADTSSGYYDEGDSVTVTWTITNTNVYTFDNTGVGSVSTTSTTTIVGSSATTISAPTVYVRRKNVCFYIYGNLSDDDETTYNNNPYPQYGLSVTENGYGLTPSTSYGTNYGCISTVYFTRADASNSGNLKTMVKGALANHTVSITVSLDRNSYTYALYGERSGSGYSLTFSSGSTKSKGTYRAYFLEGSSSGYSSTFTIDLSEASDSNVCVNVYLYKYVKPSIVEIQTRSGKIYDKTVYIKDNNYITTVSGTYIPVTIWYPKTQIPEVDGSAVVTVGTNKVPFTSCNKIQITPTSNYKHTYSIDVDDASGSSDQYIAIIEPIVTNNTWQSENSYYWYYGYGTYTSCNVSTSPTLNDMPRLIYSN